jgi:hypothetical protein
MYICPIRRPNVGIKYHELTSYSTALHSIENKSAAVVNEFVYHRTATEIEIRSFFLIQVYAAICRIP